MSTDNQEKRCSVPGCTEAAKYRVMLYDFYPRSGEVFVEQDHTCGYICVDHAMENEARAKGDRKFRGTVTYPYTNGNMAQGLTIYLPLRQV